MKLTKKILCTCLIVITVFSFMMQNLVFADEEKQFVSVSKMVSDVSAINNSLRATAKTKVIAKINEEIQDKDLATKICDYYYSDSDKLSVNYKMINAMGSDEITINEIKMNISNDELDFLRANNISSVNTDTGSIAASDQDTSGGNVVKETDSADIGGILMKPVFALVNFVADSALQILTNVMMGDQKPVYGNTYEEYRPSTSSFLTIGATKGDRVGEWLFYTPEQIFSGSIDLLSIDFISGNNNNNKDWGAIRGTIATWYKVLRLIAIIGLLSVLIYTGIKVIISSNTQNKAKYKEWIVNWFIAVAILFSMHYIMSFIIAGTNEISKLIQSSNKPIKIIYSNDENSASIITNFVGVVRFMVQSDDWYLKIGYEMMYILLVVYTFKFTFIYLKRVLNMAFLTLIAPIVALTYPIDKMNDGTAQGFNMWLKEYTFNALLQPLHQIMYYILVGSAVSIALDNPIYGVVILMFMTEAEKLLKTIFGFDKARGGTVGGMAGAFTAGALASSVKDIARMAKLPTRRWRKKWTWRK